MLQKRPLPEELGDGYTGSGQYFKAFSSDAKSRHPERNSAGDLVALGEAEAARVSATSFLSSAAESQQPLAVAIERLTHSAVLKARLPQQMMPNLPQHLPQHMVQICHGVPSSLCALSYSVSSVFVPPE